VRLDISAEEYQKAQKDRVDWLENSTGKKQDKRRQEIEHDAYISADDMHAFLLGRLEKDALGRQLVVSPRAGKVDIIDGALGSALLFLLYTHTDKGLVLLRELEREGARCEFVKPVNDAYRFQIRS
jgi:hypothetical protein